MGDSKEKGVSRFSEYCLTIEMNQSECLVPSRRDFFRDWQSVPVKFHHASSLLYSLSFSTVPDDFPLWVQCQVRLSQESSDSFRCLKLLCVTSI